MEITLKYSTTLLSMALACAAMTSHVYAADLPQVVVISTGGTIAGVSKSTTDTTNYQVGGKSGNELVRAVPEIEAVANVTVQQINNVNSPNLRYEHLLDISKAVNKSLADPKVQGVVITHGTSTAEETAIFLELTVRSPKPVVVVGAMRPSTAISADGPFNLLQAVAVAAHKESQNRGVLMLANDRIGSAMYTHKTHTQALDTFQAQDQGNVGTVIGTKPLFFFGASRAYGVPYFDVSTITVLPKVDIVYGYVEDDASFITHALTQGAKGIVVAGPGNSSLSSPMVQVVKKVSEQGVPVVRASRVGDGFATSKKEGIGAGFYNPQKARLLLSLAISQGASASQIAGYFNPYGQ